MLGNSKLKLLNLKEKVKAKIRAIPPEKLRIFPIILILVALPITVALVKIQTNTITRAAQSPGDGTGASKPDIIVVMVDDLGAIDERVLQRLPNIKSLWLDGGLRFDNAYSETPLCCPGRASFLTGQHTRNHGVTRNDARLLKPKYTIATALHDAGYFTIQAGKYLNHADRLSDKTPPGWDRVAMLMSMDRTDAKPSYWSIQGRNIRQGYSDRFVSDKSLTWLSQVPAGKPLFMWINPHAPHWGPSVSQPWIPNVEPKYASDSRCANIEPWKPPSYRYDKKPNGFPLDTICRSLLTVDDMVGKLRAQATSQGRNPIWIFTSDNGMAWGRDGFPLKNIPQAGKIQLYFAGPGITPGATQALVSEIDFGPTIAELAGTTMPKADGTSFSSILTGQASASRDWMLEDPPLGGYSAGPTSRSGSWWGVRTSDGWHLVEWPKWRGEALYYLPNDPWERNNVASSNPDKVKELKALGKGAMDQTVSTSDVEITDPIDVDDTE